MTARVTVSERDLRTLLGIVSDERSDLPAAGLPLSLLAELKDQIPCDELDFDGHDAGRQTYRFGQAVPPDDGSGFDYQLYWKLYWDSVCSYPDRTGDVRSVTKPSDFYSVRQWHSTAVYTELFRPAGLEHDLLLCLPAGQLRTLRLVFHRGPGPDFSERDRALLELLRPHLHQAYLDAERRRHPAPQLTARQRELLRLVAAGHTNRQLARRLAISEGTVRTHLENIYARLQVSSRTAAVTRAFPDPAAGSQTP
jgi:DNA-binding CsgD family transcriptional regulator